MDIDTKYLYVMGLTRRVIPSKTFSSIDEEYYDYYQSKVIECLRAIEQKTGIHSDDVLTILADPTMERDMTFLYFSPHHFLLSAEKILSVLDPLSEKEKKEAQRQLLEVMANHHNIISSSDLNNWKRLWRTVGGSESQIDKYEQAGKLLEVMSKEKEIKERQRFEEYRRRYFGKSAPKESLPYPGYKEFKIPPPPLIERSPIKYVPKKAPAKQFVPAKYVETKKYVRFYL